MAIGLEVEVQELLEGEGEVSLTQQGAVADLGQVRLFLFKSASSPALTIRTRVARPPGAGPSLWGEEDNVERDLDIELGRRLGVDAAEIRVAAYNVFARTLAAERDRRFSLIEADSLTQQTARRGHISRELGELIRSDLRRRGLIDK